MSLYVLVEKEFINSSWCTSILEGLNNEKKRKKIKLNFINSTEEIKDISNNFKSSVILIGAKPNWITETITEILHLKLNPILISNTLISTEYSDCNIVTSDIFGAISDAFSLYNPQNSTALYGVNSDSVSDRMRKKAYLTVGGNKDDIYYNTGLLKDCFFSFLPNYNKYNTIICVNDFAAVSLINRLKSENIYNDKIAIISLSGSLIGERFSPSISSFSINYENFGAAAILIHEVLSKNKYISTFNSLIKYDLNVKETTPNLTFSKISKAYIVDKNEKDVNIYNDTEMAELMSIENFLKSTDNSDMLIIKMVKNKDNYDAISDATYLSPSSVKYRVKNMCKIFNVNNIVSAISFLEKYIVI